MSRFTRVIKYLASLYPPAEVAYHQPGFLREEIQLVQEAIPWSEVFGDIRQPVVVVVAGAAAGDFVQDEFVNPDGPSGTPTGVLGVAFVVWAAEVQVALAGANSLRFGLQDGSGIAAGRVGLGTPIGTAAASPVGSILSLDAVPVIVPPRFAFCAMDNAGGSTLTLRLVRSTIQRGEPLPHF